MEVREMEMLMTEEQVRALQTLPIPQSCRVISFDSARVVTLPTRPPRRVLIVSGEKPYFNMKVFSPLWYTSSGLSIGVLK